MTGSVAFGAIGDDFTGAVELAGMLTAGGARTLFVTSPADIPTRIENTDAIVVALRSRVAPAAEARAEVGEAARALQALGTHRIFFNTARPSTARPPAISAIAPTCWRI